MPRATISACRCFWKACRGWAVAKSPFGLIHPLLLLLMLLLLPLLDC
jgi:hypothetical protein